MSKTERKKGLAVLVSMMILTMIAMVGCENITAANDTLDVNSRAAVKIVRETDENGYNTTWRVILDEEQSEYGLNHYENLIVDFATKHAVRGKVELDELATFITENIGDYEIIDEYVKTRGGSALVIVPTGDGKVTIVVVNA